MIAKIKTQSESQIIVNEVSIAKFNATNFNQFKDQLLKLLTVKKQEKYIQKDILKGTPTDHDRIEDSKVQLTINKYLTNNIKESNIDYSSTYEFFTKLGTQYSFNKDNINIFNLT